MVALRFAVILLCATLAVFSGALWAPFHLDDHSLRLAPPVGVNGPPAEGLRWTQTRPLTWMTFWANRQVSEAPLGFHLVNLLLHAAAGVLCWFSLRELLPERAAQIGAAVFALHPLQTEAVTYVFARATLLSVLLCLAALLLWLKGRRWGAVALFGLALLAKEEVAAFPLFLLLLQFTLRKPKEGLAPIGAMTALAGAAGLRTMAAAALIAGSGAGAQAGVTSFEYFAQQGVAILRYLWLMLVPVGLTIEPQLTASPWPCSLAWGVIAVVAVLALRRFHEANEGFWLLAGLLLLAPSSSIFPAADLAADRRMYFPLMAFGAMAGLVLRRTRPVVLIGVAALFGAVSYAQVRVWQSEQSLWMEAARAAPDRIRPKRQLARLLAPQQALPMLEEARELAPDDAGVRGDLGRLYLETGQPAKALQEFGRALALEPSSARALNNRGVALFALGQTGAAVADWRRALEVDGCLFDAYLNLQRAGANATSPDGCAFTKEERQQLEARQP